jgi:uncharacterized membrane protein YphA (DoxX/SURF4 family)
LCGLGRVGDKAGVLELLYDCERVLIILVVSEYEIDITYLILSIILIVLGAGALSVDSVIGLLW